MAPPPEYDKEPKAPDKSATNISCEEMKTVHNLVNDQQNNSDNKSASTASNADVENNKLVETLDDGQLRALLDEAITYKCPKDREGKSSLFKELLEEVEQDEQATEAAARSLNTRAGSTRAARAGRNRRALPHSNSLQDLVAALAAEPAPRRHRPAPAPAPAPVSTRAIHGGSLPSGVDTSFLLGEEPIGGGYLATVRCVNPPPLTERLSSDEADLARRSKQVFPMTYTARATLEIGSGAVSSGRAVTTTTASNQVRTSPRTARYHPRKPRHQPAQTQTYRIPPVNGNREPYMLNRNKPNMALNYRNPPGSIPYANVQRPIVPYYRRPPTCGPPERICVKKLYNPKRRTFVKHVQTKRVLTQKSINDFKSEKKQQHSFGGEIKSNSSVEHNVDEKTDNVKPESPKDDNTKSDKSLSSGDENIDSNQSKLLRGLIAKTNCDKDNGGGSSKKTTNENEPRGPKANTENKNTEDKKHKKKNIEKPKNIEKKLRKNPNSDLWETHNNNWYNNSGGFTQASIAPEKGKTPFYRMFKEQDNNFPRDKSANIHSNFFVQNIARSDDNNLSVYPTTAPVNFSLNRPNNMTQNIYKGVNKHSYKKTDRKNEDWVSGDFNTRSYNYYDYLYQTEMKYRKCIGTGLVKRKIDFISPTNIRKTTIGKPLPDFFNIVDNSSTNEYTTDKVKVNNDENKTSKNIKESVSDVIQLSDSYEDFVASSNDTKETKNYFEEDDNIEDETVNLSVRSSTPVNEPNDNVYQVTEQTKLEKEVDDIDNASETIRNEDIPPPVENDQGTVHIPVVSQSDYIAIDDFCSFSQVKDEPCGEVIELVKMSSIPEENTIEQLNIFKNINSTNENCVELKDMSSQGVERKHQEELLSISFKSHSEENSFSRYLAEQQKLFRALENSGVVDDSIEKRGVEQKHEEELLSVSLKRHHEEYQFSRYLAKQQKLFQALENSGIVDNSVQKHGIEQKYEKQQKLFQALENSVAVDSIQKHSLVNRLDNSEKVHCPLENECISEYVQDKIEKDSLDIVPNEPTSSIVECSNSDTAGPCQEAVIRLDESAVKNTNGENDPNEPTSSIVECTNSDTVRPSQEVVIRLDESAVENANGKNVPNEPTSSLVECSNSDTAGTSQEVVIHLDEPAVENANGKNDPNEPTSSKIECSKSHTAEPSQEVVIHLDESAVENANDKNVPNEPTSSIVECSNSDTAGPCQEAVIRLDESAVKNTNGENDPNEPTSSIVECTNSDTLRPSQEVVIRLDESALENANGKNVTNEPTSSLVECSNSDTAGTSQKVVIHLDESAVENVNGKNDPNEPTSSKIECSKSDTAGPSQEIVIHLDESAVENANDKNVPNEPTSSIVEYSDSYTAELSQELVLRLDDPGVDSEYFDEYILGDNNACVFLTLPQHLLSHINYNENTIQLQIENNTCEKIHCAHENEFSSEYVQYKIEKDSLDNVSNEPTSSIVECSNLSQKAVIHLDVSAVENTNGNNVPNEPTSSLVECSNSDTARSSQEVVIQLDESAVENANGENVPNEPTSFIVECSNSDTAGPSQEVVIHLDESAVENANGENVPNEPTSSIVECSNSDTAGPSQEVVIHLDESAVENANGENVPNEPTSSMVECSNSDTAGPSQEVVIHLDESAVENANGENVPNEPTSSIVECSNSDTVGPSQEVVIHLDESAVENANGENVPNEPTSSIVECSNSDTAGPSQEVVIHLDESAVENANGENVPNEPTSSIVECSNSDTAGPSQEVVLRLDDPAVESAYCDEYVLAELPYNAYVFLTLPQHLLSHINYNENTIQLQIENNNKPYISGGNSTKGKKKKISLENSKNREVTNKNALKTLLFENNSKSDSADKSVRKGTSTISKPEVDSAIPFSCITTPEVVASCNTTASTTQSAVAVDPKPLQLESSYHAVSSLTGELPPALSPALNPAPAPAAPAHPPTLITQDQPRSVISSTFNGLPLSRPNYGSTATTTQDEYKKSIDENGNSVQGFSSPLSGSSQHKKPRRKKSSKNETVIKSHQIDGYQGNKDLNEVLRFIESNAESTRAGKLGRTKHKDDADDKGGKKRSTERRKDKENKMKRATSMEELSRTKLEDLTDKPAKKERWPAGAAPKAERRSWGDDARESFYYHEPEPDADFQTVTKKRKPRRRPDDASEPPEAAAGDPPRPSRAPEPRARRVSAPPSDRSNDSNDDMDSVHSLPADAPRAPPHAPVSYADIARTRHNIPDLIESCNFYAEGEGEGGELRGVLQPAGGGYPALEPRAPRRAPPARELKPGAPPATTNVRPHRKERAESGSAAEPAVTVVEEAAVGLDAEVPAAGEWPAPDVVGDRRPAVILLDSAQRPPDMDGVTFGFDINEQLLGGPTRRPRCDLVRDAIEGGTVPVAETNGAAIDGVTDAADIVIGDATMGVATLGPALGVVTQTALGVVVSAGCAALRYVPPRPPPDTHHLHQIIDYVGAAWEDVVRCGAGKVRYFSE